MIRVIETFSDFRDISLQERTDTAIRLGADVFVSIHANAFGSGWNDVRGVETFTFDGKGKSKELALGIQRRLVPRYNTHNREERFSEVESRGVKEANYHVLRETQKRGIPSVLVEAGFMTNWNDYVLLCSPDYRATVAGAIYEAIGSNFDLNNLVVAVDAGHGPSTPGKRSPNGKLKEYFFNRAVANSLIDYLTTEGSN